VATYGYLALLAGRPQAARQVGRLMAHAPAAVAAHRVVSHTGRPAPGCPKHRPLLEAEGVSFKPSGRVNLREHLWRF
jgi:methylated-DNA-protein-cysteine methyltransferase-like protein